MGANRVVAGSSSLITVMIYGTMHTAKQNTETKHFEDYKATEEGVKQENPHKLC